MARKMKTFDMKDRSTWPELNQEVNLRVIKSDGEIFMDTTKAAFRPPAINLPSDDGFMVTITSEWFDLFDGVLIPAKTNRIDRIEWWS